jgi:hypothetical protein
MRESNQSTAIPRRRRAAGGTDGTIVCLYCGWLRGAGTAAECPECGYLGWAPQSDLAAHEQALIQSVLQLLDRRSSTA